MACKYRQTNYFMLSLVLSVVLSVSACYMSPAKPRPPLSALCLPVSQNVRTCQSGQVFISTDIERGAQVSKDIIPSSSLANQFRNIGARAMLTAY
jgi:hypothetical protein